MDELSHMTLDKFRLWSIHALKVFLSCRNRTINGEFDELAARAFCVWEENLPVNENAEMAEKRLLQEYKKKLVLDGDVVPDTFSISSGWKGEKAAVNTWPSIYITDIATYLGCSTTKDVMNRLLSEYKVGKAYRYFESEWVKEVYIHDVRESSDKCILKTKVTPSQAINNKCYDDWVSVTKDNVNGPGGEIISAYCSCTAGILGSCNHVAGLLFRVEHAVKTGATKKSSTSKLSEWNVPKLKGKPSMKPKKAVDAIWSKGRYDKRVTSEEEEKQRKEMKNKFTPLTTSQHEQVNNQVKTRTDLYDLLRTEISNSCFVLCQEKRRIKAPKADIPDSVIKIADEMKSSETDKHVATDKFVDKLTLSIERPDNLKKATLEQSSSQTWKEHRKGRTASIFQRVSSRVETLRKNDEADPSALVETILGQKETKQTVAMKHGLALEPQAKKVYTQKMRKIHNKFKSSDSGLSVFIDKPYIAASADLEVECECCGKGLCEIKCPESIKEQSPLAENLKYIKIEEGKTLLDVRQPYYYQIQVQMKILNRQYCDLFIYTCHGDEQVRITFDNSFWETLEEKLTWFWTVHVAPQLLGVSTTTENTVKLQETETEASVEPQDLEKENTIKSRQGETPTKSTQSEKQSHVRRALEPVVQQETKVTQPKKRMKTKPKIPIYLCGTCGCDCLDIPLSEDDQSVNCDKCGVWVHYVCAGVSDKELEAVDKWYCHKCK